MSVLAARPDACFRYGACVCGREDWLRSDNDLCYWCIRGDGMSTAITRTQVEDEIKPHGEALAEYLSPDARGMTIDDEEELQLVANIINDIKARAKDLETREKAVTAPILAGVEVYRSMFRPLRQGYAEARAIFDSMVRDYAQRRAARNQANEAALAAAVEAQDEPAAASAINALIPVAKTAGLVVQDAWDFEEFNHDIVPTSLTVLSRAAVLAEIKRQVAYGETPAIPGLRIFKREVVKAVGR